MRSELVSMAEDRHDRRDDGAVVLSTTFRVDLEYGEHFGLFHKRQRPSSFARTFLLTTAAIGRPTGAVPTPRYFHSCAVHNGSMYVFGGYNGSDRLSDFFEHNFETGQWTELVRGPMISSLLVRDAKRLATAGRSIRRHGAGQQTVEVVRRGSGNGRQESSL